MKQAASEPVLGFPVLGFVEQFHLGEHQRAGQTIAAMRAIGIDTLRTCISWADYHAEGGEAWFDWLLAELGPAFDLLVLVDAPTDHLHEFAALLLSRHGAHFRRIELAIQHDEREWAAISDAASGAWQGGWEVVLRAPPQDDVLERLGQRGMLARIAALELHASWTALGATLGAVPDLRAMSEAARAILSRYNPRAQLWLTAPLAPHPDDEASQLAALLDAPCERITWPDRQAGADGVSLARRLLKAGLLRQSRLFRPSVRRGCDPVLVLGGAGFIGSNLAESFLNEGREVIVFDNLSRPGTERNLAWLVGRHGGRVHPMLADLRDPVALHAAVTGASAVFHLAAQVAVTSSLADPRHDFRVNAEGTLNVLEAVRAHAPSAPIVFASTNKVYGQLTDVSVADFGGRTLPQDADLRSYGLSESRPLDFCTPYGCSKGVADQYVLDYAQSFGLRSAVLRMSCIYGPRQFGTEDQGWLAHFLVRALTGEPITIFGNGRQVRDVLHVADAVRAYRSVLSGIDDVRGRAFNLGGGPANAVSLHLVLAEIETLLQRRLPISYQDWRAGDQPYFVADTRALREATGWRPRIGWRDGLRDLAAWLRQDFGMTDAGTKRRALA